MFEELRFRKPTTPNTPENTAQTRVPDMQQKPPEQIQPQQVQAAASNKPAANQPPTNAIQPPAQNAKQQPAAQAPKRLGDRLLEMGLISKDQLEVALKEQKATGSKKMVGTVLVEMGFITEATLGEILSESSGAEKFDPKTTVLDSEVIRTIPKHVAQRQKCVAVAVEGNTVILAMVDVYNVLAIDQARRYFPKSAKIRPVYSTESDINELIEKYYDYETSIDGILKEIETGIIDAKQLDGRQEGYVNPTVRLVNAFLVDAIRSGTSDIHFEPEATFLRVRYRIDGELVQVRSLHKEYWQAITVRIKIMSGMNIAESRMPQDGRINYNVAGREVDFRVATQPTVHGENIVMRLLDRKKSLVPIPQLGFSEHNEKLLKKLLLRPEGIIIVTGPTGSGKTTTLYSILEYMNSVDVNIMTLEDPVEYQLSLIRQSYIREGSGMSFSDGIKSIMRQDPDIIFIGEVRDNESANMAVRASMTGHKVFTTLHTNDAMGVIPRLMDIGVKPDMLAGSMICAVAQRLVRKLCQSCKEEYTASEQDCKILGVDPAKPPKIYKAKGCEKCADKGYKGRMGIHEILPVDKGMDELIATQATRKVMRDYAISKGFVQMIDDASGKVLRGLTSVEEIMGSVDVTERL